MNTDLSIPRGAVGFNAASPGVGFLDFTSLPEDVRTRTFSFRAKDGGASRGILYTRGGEKTVVCISHPRADQSQHYIIPALLSAGFAAYSHQCRGLNNDVDCVHEELLLDLAAGYGFLRSEMGFEKLVLFGQSGGGSLLTYYQEQAALLPSDRFVRTPAGAPSFLDQLEMPVADGLVMLGVHPGEGLFMLDAIDPSVIDENDPLSIDPALDMYNPDNGFREPPEKSCYTDAFLDRYRVGQRVRTERLDAKALDLVGRKKRHDALRSSSDFAALSQTEKNRINREAVCGYYMIIYRTEADPAYCDLRLHAWESTRSVGSMISNRPDLANYAGGGFGRYLTPRAWLSTWSPSYSRAAIPRAIQSVSIPVLMISYTGNNGCFPDLNRDHLEGCPSSDKSLILFNADHFGFPLEERGRAIDNLTFWLRERFPVAHN